MENHFILGVHVTDRVKEVPKIQMLLTEYGNCIRTRLGLHNPNDAQSAPGGVILLELVGDAARGRALAAKLATVEGVEVKELVFGKP